MVNRVLIDGFHHLKPSEGCRVEKSASFDLFGREAVIFFVFKKVVGGMMDLPCSRNALMMV